jgi:hypothetical protein
LMRKEARHPLFLKVLSSDNFFLKSLESLVFIFWWNQQGALQLCSENPGSTCQWGLKI